MDYSKRVNTPLFHFWKSFEESNFKWRGDDWKRKGKKKNRHLPRKSKKLKICYFKVAEHSFGSLWVYVICQIMAREGLQLTSWNLASAKYTDERFCLTVKFDIFVVSMATWTIEYNLKISLLLSLQKTHSLDFPINLHIAYYN